MKRKAIFLSAVLLPIFCTVTFAQSRQQPDSATGYYTRLLESGDPADKAKLQTELFALLKSDKEQDWIRSVQNFYRLGKVKVSDSIVTVGKKKFPVGVWMRDEAIQRIYDENDPVKKEQQLLAVMKKFPPKSNAEYPIGFDYASHAVACAYVDAGNVKKAVEYANKVQTQAWKGEGWAGVANRLIKAGHYKEGEELMKKAWDISYRSATEPNLPGAGFTAMGLPGYTRILVDLNIERQDYEGAMRYLKPVYENVPKVTSSLDNQYSVVLLQMGKKPEAFDILERSVKGGYATTEMKDRFKTLWSGIKGTDAGYTDFMTAVNKSLAIKMKEELNKQMINLPAPLFTLKDVDGNSVSMADLKGKVIILDFWATWCGPCKASFPGMKRTMEKYAQDKDVKFLFIHTMEREQNAAESAKKYITQNNYPFEVLMDLKDDEAQNLVKNAYKIEGIPTKFIIDRNGNIRFRVLGASGGNYDPVEHLSAMIDQVKSI